MSIGHTARLGILRRRNSPPGAGEKKCLIALVPSVDLLSPFGTRAMIAAVPCWLPQRGPLLGTNP